MTVPTLWINLYRTTNNWLDKATKKGTWSKSDQEWYDATKRFNPAIWAYKDRYEREKYMDRYGIGYGDVTQPWNLPGGSDAGHFAGLASRALNFVSHNLDELYSDEDPAEARKKALMEKYYRADFRR